MDALTIEELEKLPDLPEVLAKASVKVRQAFILYLENPGRQWKDIAVEVGLTPDAVRAANRQYGFNKVARQHLVNRSKEFLSRRQEEAAVAQHHDYQILVELWKTVTTIRDLIFDDNGELKDMIQEREEFRNSKGAVIRTKTKHYSPIPKLREYQKAIKEFVELRRTVTGLELTDKIQISQAGAPEIINNVGVAFGEDYSPAFEPRIVG